MSMNKDSDLYCSQCKFSQYVTYKGEKCLFCSKLQTHFLTSSTVAERCKRFQSEFWQNNLTSRKDYVRKMRHCGIPLFLEKHGFLANIRLE